MFLFLAFNKDWLAGNFDKIKLSCIFLFFILIALVIWEIIWIRTRQSSNITFLKQDVEAPAGPPKEEREQIVEVEDIFKTSGKTSIIEEASKVEEIIREPKSLIETEKVQEAEGFEEDPWQKLIKESATSKKQRIIKLEDDSLKEEGKI